MSFTPARRQVPITDLGLEYQTIKKDLTPLLDQILNSGAYVLGPQLTQFEKDLATYINARHAVGLNSGTDAVLIGLRALHVGAGDEVIVPAMSFFATVEPILLLGAKPVFVDIDPVSYALDPKQVSERISPQTKAIIAVHLYGCPADLKALSRMA
jgi:dTDP-4-amino-4,6-dideoxygalactose transaminase